MPENWVAALFTEPRKEEPKPTWCQTCLEDKIEKEATQWCETCLRNSKIGFFCDECAASEHSTRTTKSHVRLPLGRLPTVFVFPECPTHKLHEDFYCIDDNKLVCHRCLRDDHKPHRTKLAFDYAEESRADLQAEVSNHPHPLLVSSPHLLVWRVLDFFCSRPCSGLTTFLVVVDLQLHLFSFFFATKPAT
jgi:hypothetical protein